MKYLVTASLLATTIIFADETVPSSDADKLEYEHRFNFNVGEVGYEYLAKNAPYAAINAKAVRLLITKDVENKEWFSETPGDIGNIEVRVGYNWHIKEKNILLPYVNAGYSYYKFHNRHFSLRDWPYLGIGLKYIYQFGDTFGMGIHFNGKFSIAEIFHRASVYDTYFKTWVRSKKRFVKQKPGKFYEGIGVPIVWNLGEKRNWEIILEPFYSRIPDNQIPKTLETNITLGYRF